MKQVTQQQPIELHRADIHAGHLILVNRNHPVKLQVEDQSLEQQCSHQLFALLEACEALDEITIVSGYRSLEEQQHIYETSMRDNGAEFTAQYVARPGESEHQTGLAVDVGEMSDNVDYLCPSFPDHGVCLRFKQLAAKYGFVQRYQEGKETITGIACEPWHYRYVGFPHSMIMEQIGFCLEEYIEYIGRYTYQRPYRYSDKHVIYYVPAQEEITLIPVMNGAQTEVSGNNKDGFIITACFEQGSDHGGI